jgi:alkylation response protein AidB-like acyl-CoA dehydrogenase
LVTDRELDLEEVRTAVRDYAERRLRPIADECDRKGAFPLEIVPELGELGFLGLGFPEDYGGSGVGKLAYAIAVEETYRISAGIAASAFMSPLIAYDILMSASEQQKRTLLPDILSGRKIAALAVTEPDAGSDAGAIQTRATRSDEGYVLNGRKRFITNGSIADVVLVMARTSPGSGNKGLSLFSVARGTRGLVAEQPMEKLGWRASDTADLVFEDCYVDTSNLIGELDAGFRVIMEGFNLERITLAAGSVGLGQAALEESTHYASVRRQFGHAIGEFQAVRQSLGRMATEVEAARQLTYAAGRLLDAGKPVMREASMAKLFASEMCQRVTREAIQLHGGVGFTMESPVQRFYRDSMIMTIGGGTSTIQAEIVARTLPIPRSELG